MMNTSRATACADARRSGFTVVELLVVSLLGIFLLMATYSVLITNQRTYSAQAAQVQGMQTTRAALDILTGELREISIAGGDLLQADSTSLVIRTMRRFGLVCNVAAGPPPVLTVRKVGSFFPKEDSVFIFAENDEATANDDTWITASITTLDTTGVACGTAEAQTFQFADQAPLFNANTVRVGAPVRSFDRYEYRKAVIDGQTVVARRDTASTIPLVGPVDADGGLQFEYFDNLGNPTNIIANIAQIAITIISTSDATTSLGSQVRDSVTVRVYPRN